MNGARWGVVLVLAMGVGFVPLAAQERDVRRELAERGAPAAFADPVLAQVEATRAAGLPAGPVMDKALEGWAKHVPVQRVVTALEQLRTRLEAGRAAVARTGQPLPPEPVITGAAEALAQGLEPEDVRQLATDAPSPEMEAAGLMVAASLRAQGLGRAAAVRAVQDGYRRGLETAQLYELPSAVAELTGRGMAVTDVARRIMEGGGLPLPPTAGGPGQGGGRPGGVPPAPGGQGQGQGTTKRRK